MHRAFKVRIYPSKNQSVFLNQQFGAVRMVYNKGLAVINHQYKRHNTSLNAIKHIKPLLSVAKKSRKYNWLKSYDSIALQEACRNLNIAFNNFFKKTARYPKFKNKHGKQSSYHCTSIEYGSNWIKIPKLKSSIKARLHQEVHGKLKSITLSRTSTGKYYASLLVDTKEEIPSSLKVLDINRITGLDVGIEHILNDSNGQKKSNPRFLIKAHSNLRRKQKSLSRKQKGSNGRAKARLLVAKCHEKVANARNDFQHKVTRQLVDESQAIVVETLKVKNMIRNHKLARHISDASWGSLLEKLEYKAKWSGKYFVKIDQYYASSKTCSNCSHKLKDLSLKVRHWVCTECKILHDRDINAALNIKHQGIIKLKAAGLSVSANGGLRKSDCISAVA